MDKRPHAPDCFCYKCEAEQFSAARAAKEKADDRLARTACSAAPDDFEERMMDMDIHELRSRILTQRDYLKKMHSCLDGLPIPADCNTNIDGCRDHHDIRWIVKKLLSRLPNAERTRGADNQ